MDKIAAYEMLLAQDPLWTKEGSSMSKLRAFGVPAATAAAGGIAGGAAGSASTDDPDKKRGRMLAGAAGGALAGGLAGVGINRLSRRGGSGQKMLPKKTAPKQLTDLGPDDIDLSQYATTAPSGGPTKIL
jgi:hypothetical protein